LCFVGSRMFASLRFRLQDMFFMAPKSKVMTKAYLAVAQHGRLKYLFNKIGPVAVDASAVKFKAVYEIDNVVVLIQRHKLKGGVYIPVTGGTLGAISAYHSVVYYGEERSLDTAGLRQFRAGYLAGLRQAQYRDHGCEQFYDTVDGRSYPRVAWEAMEK